MRTALDSSVILDVLTNDKKWADASQQALTEAISMGSLVIGECVLAEITPALDSGDLSTFLETSDEWIVSRTGMKERRVSHVSAIELSTLAAARALACAGLDAADCELIIYGSCSNEEVVPNCASGVQVGLGATGAASMDINTACTSFIYGLATATSMIRTGVVKNAVVIGV